MKASMPIGVFDSGVGGLTVLSAISKKLAGEDLIYLGDTARLPYGTKSVDTITRYALQASAKLVERGVKLLVVACNTASAAALPALQKAYPDLPVLGVVEPGARAACAASVNGRILVLATESTIKNKAYQRAIHAIQPKAEVTGVPCSLFVALAEEGWVNGPIVESVAKEYLKGIFALDSGDGGSHRPVQPEPDCLVLGCTHFPPLAASIKAVAGNGVTLVDSAESTALTVAEALAAYSLLNANRGSTPGTISLLTTDNEARFARTGSVFMGRHILESDVELVCL